MTLQVTRTHPVLCRYILDKKIGVGQPKRIENARILVANTAMDTDKIKIYGARVRVDSLDKVGRGEGEDREGGCCAAERKWRYG
jgi:hypothetical protein